jgi:alanine racemase
MALRDRFDPWVEVISDHLGSNIQEVQRLSGDKPILAVVKNNGYGLGLTQVALRLDGHPGISGFAVVKGEEALELRSAGIRKPILLMGLFSPQEGRDLVEAGIQLSAFTPDAVQRIVPLARASGNPVEVHIYLDTGMGRMGMSFRDALPWMRELTRHPEIRVRGTFTELGEEPGFDRVQLDRFRELVQAGRAEGMELGSLHTAASNGVFHLSDSHLDMVRPGIALFGSYPSRPEEERTMARLRSAVRFRTRVVRVSHLMEGDGVGYGRPWIADAPTWVATLPVGHADGYAREAVDGAQVLINGTLYPVIGGVSASHCILRIGHNPSVRVGDIATLMGPDHPAIEPNTLAQTLNVSVYDLLMHLNPALPRIPTTLFSE